MDSVSSAASCKQPPFDHRLIGPAVTHAPSFPSGSPVYLLVAFIMIDSYKNRHLIQTGKGPEQTSVSHELRWLEELSVHHLHQASGEEGGQQEDGKEDVGS
ncbi:hypothetical protein HDU99_009816, partial [Rhizoclosmatium hyalinum]